MRCWLFGHKWLALDHGSYTLRMCLRCDLRYQEPINEA